MWWQKPRSACGKETQFPFGLIGRSIKCSYKQVGFQTIIIMKYRCRTRCTCTYMYLKAPIIRVQIKNITFADREYRFSFASVVLDDGRACATVEFQLSFIPDYCQRYGVHKIPYTKGDRRTGNRRFLVDQTETLPKLIYKPWLLLQNIKVLAQPIDRDVVLTKSPTQVTNFRKFTLFKYCDFNIVWSIKLKP